MSKRVFLGILSAVLMTSAMVAFANDNRGRKGRDVFVTKYEYFLKHRADGAEWTWKLIATVDNERTETVYDENCELPVSITRGNRRAIFKYDSKCHVTQKETPEEVTNIKYDPRAGKVSHVERYLKRGKTKPVLDVVADYKYEGKGNLEYGESNEYNNNGRAGANNRPLKRWVKLGYDNVGRIKVLVDQAKRNPIFDYNNQSKPVKITVPGQGALGVDYDNAGQVKKVNNPGGEKIPQLITDAFDNLAAIINPAGVTLELE